MGQHRNGKRSSLSQVPEKEHHSVVEAREKVIRAARLVMDGIRIYGFPRLEDLTQLDLALVAYDRKRSG